MKKMMIATMIGVMSIGSLAQAAMPTQDDLVKVDRGVFKETYVNPSVDLAGYSKVMIEPAEFEFRAVRKRSRMTEMGRSGKKEFWMSEKDQDRAVDLIGEAFEKEIAQSALNVVEQPGEGVLVLSGGFYDITNHVPRPPVGSSSETWVLSAGSATFVVEARDSVTGELLYRAAERRDAKDAGRDLFNATRPKTNQVARRWARQMAERLVDGMEAVHSF